jgi:hypothetical protein
MIELLYFVDTVVSEMSRDLLASIEAGCYGTMKVEGGKLVFDASGVVPRPPIGPVPTAPPLVEEDNHRVIDELRETKERLAVLEQRYDKLEQMFCRAQESVCFPRFINAGQACYLYNFNTGTLRFIDAGWSQNPARNYLVYVGNTDVPFGDQNPLPTLLGAIRPHLRPDIHHFIIRPRGTITPDCGVIIKFIIEWMKTSPNRIDITISNTTENLAIGFVVGLCEQLNPEKLSKLVITQAKMCEHTELKNKIHKGVFKIMAFDKLVASL